MSIKTVITKVGQPYVDDEVLVRPKPLSAAVTVAFGGKPAKPLVVAYERTKLVWVRADFS